MTHLDKDHIGGMADVLRNFAVERFFMPELPEELIPTSRSYEEMLLALEETGVRVQRPSVGEVLTFGQASLHVLAPGTFFPESSNDNSVVCRLVFGEISFLFMGDAEEPAEEALLSSGQALASTVLKVGHHGSNTSTTQALLSAVQPRYAVISVGEDENNLPKNKVLKRLTANQIPFYRTDLNGTVLFLTDGKDLKIETER